MTPIDPAAPPINFRGSCPRAWNHRYVQVGGGGMNGSILGLTGGSWHRHADPTRRVGWRWRQRPGHSGFGRGVSAERRGDQTLAMQMKQTRDAAWRLMKRLHGGKPCFALLVEVRGRREGSTVMKKYPSDLNGIVVTVPIVNFLQPDADR